MGKKEVVCSSMEMTLRRLLEDGGIAFKIYHAGHGLLKCRMNHTWEILSVTNDDKVLSFIAAEEGRNPGEYSVRSPEQLNIIRKWFKDTASELKAIKNRGKEVVTTLPEKVVFQFKVKEFAI